MSLLNDMLRDLSQRKQVADGVEAYDDSLLESSSLVKKKDQSWVYLVIFFSAVFCVVLVVKHFLFPTSVVQEQPKATLEHRSVPKTIAEKAPAPIENEKGAAFTEATTKETVESAVNQETQNHINDLFTQAERAIAMDRLTSPIEDNAYNYYQKILTLSPKDNAAKDGLDMIASRYMAKAQEQMKLGNVQQAQALIQRARFVSERYVQAHEISVNESVVENFGGPTEEKSPASETIKSLPIAEAQSLSVVPNADWKDEQLARHAQELVQQGKQVEAMALLKNFVVSEQKPALAAAVLADLYIRQGNTQAASILLEKADYMAADSKAKLQAQIFVAEGDEAQAIAVLEKNIAFADGNESYRSLLAGLYHKTANYQQSIKNYQSLLANFGEKPAYWLGLALAYDGLGQSKNALQAYKHVAEFPQLQEQVKKYTGQRIAALSSE